MAEQGPWHRPSRPFGSGRRAPRSRCSFRTAGATHESLDTIFAARPDVLNHNIETVARLQRAVRPSAGYARSLGVLARAGAAGLVTKSGLMVGLGEREEEVIATMADLRAVGVSIITIGQYLRPSSDHLPVSRYWTPEEFDRLKEIGRRARRAARGSVTSYPVQLPRPRCRRGSERPRPARSAAITTPWERRRSRLPPRSIAGFAIRSSRLAGGGRDAQATKYLAAGWWQMMASVVCSGSIWNPSLTVTPMRSPPRSSTTFSLSVSSGQAG